MKCKPSLLPLSSLLLLVVFLKSISASLGPLVFQVSFGINLSISLFGTEPIDGSDGKASAYSAGDLGSIPESGRSPEEGNGNPLQYSCLENSMDGGLWWFTVHRVAQS